MDIKQDLYTKLDAIGILLDECRQVIGHISIAQAVTPPPDIVLPTIIPADSGYDLNPYPDRAWLVPVINDDHLTADPKIMDNALGSRYWRMLWEIADRAKVRLVVMRGQHPDGCVDVAYPTIDGKLDRAAMGRIIGAFLAVCVPLPDKSTNETEIRLGADVWQMVPNRHVQVDLEKGDPMHHRFDDPMFPHFHLRLGVP